MHILCNYIYYKLYENVNALLLGVIHDRIKYLLNVINYNL